LQSSVIRKPEEKTTERFLQRVKVFMPAAIRHAVMVLPNLLDDDFESFGRTITARSEEHTSELQSPCNLVCRLLLEKKKQISLDDLEPLVERGSMTDEEMVAYLVPCLMEPTSPRPSIDTLLTGFVPQPHNDHTNPYA